MDCFRARWQPRIFIFQWLISITHMPPFHVRGKCRSLHSVFQMDIPFNGVLDLFLVRLERMAQQVALCGRGVEMIFDGA